MQATDRIRDRTKPIQTSSTSVFIRPVAAPYQRPVTNTRANTSFSRLSSSILGTMTPMPQHSDKEQARLMKEGRCFSCKERGHTAYEYPRKGKIATISKSLIEDNSSQGKEQFLPKSRKRAFLFYHHSCQRTYFARVLLLFNVH